MRIVIIGGPKRGKSSLGRHLAKKHGLKHLCTDPQHMCDAGIIGTPDDLNYGDVSQWVADNWIGQENTVVEGVRSGSALSRVMRGAMKLPVDRVIFLRRPLAPAGRDGQKAQATKSAIHMNEIWDKVANILEDWVPDGHGGWKKTDRLARI